MLDDLLEDWQSNYRPPFEGIRVVGSHWLPASHQVKDFLARNNIPYRWLDPETNEEAKQLLELSDAKLELPCLFFPDGTRLEKPDNREIADRVGWPLRQCMSAVAQQVMAGTVRLAYSQEVLSLALYELARKNFSRASSRLTSWCRDGEPGPITEADAEENCRRSQPKDESPPDSAGSESETERKRIRSCQSDPPIAYERDVHRDARVMQTS